MPQMMDVCESIHRSGSTLILALGELPGTAERVRVLDSGADDCQNRPIEPEEVAARVRALLRRHPLGVVAEGTARLRVTDAWMLDLAGQQLIAGASVKPLTEREFHLLAFLVRHEGVTVTRERLLHAVWGPGHKGSKREVDVYVHYLRQKLEPDPARPRYVVTVWGRGYRYQPPTDESVENS